MEGGSLPVAQPSAEVIGALNELLQLDYDAIGAYEIAIDELEDRDHATRIAAFKADHERHIRELNTLIERMGGTPHNNPHATAPLKHAMQSLGAMGGDRGILLAWRANELQLRNRYDEWASRALRWPAEAKRLVARNALDEEGHYQWVAGVLREMGVSLDAPGRDRGAGGAFRGGSGSPLVAAVAALTAGYVLGRLLRTRRDPSPD